MNACRADPWDPKTLPLICYSSWRLRPVAGGVSRGRCHRRPVPKRSFLHGMHGHRLRNWEACFYYRFIAMTWMGRVETFLPEATSSCARPANGVTCSPRRVSSTSRQGCKTDGGRTGKGTPERMDEAPIKLWPIPWSTRAFHLQHYQALWAEAETALYFGEPEHAWHLIQERWPALQQSALLHVQYIRLTLLQLRARCALAAATHATDEAQASAFGAQLALKSVASDVHSIEPRTDALVQCGSTTGCAPAWARDPGEPGGSHRAPGRGRDRLPGSEHGPPCRVRPVLPRSTARRGASGSAELIQAASETMTSQEIRSPERLLRIIAPGLTDLTA